MYTSLLVLAAASSLPAALAQSAEIVNPDIGATIQGEIIGTGAEGTTYLLSNFGIFTNGIDVDVTATLVEGATAYSLDETIVVSGTTLGANGRCTYSSVNPTATIFTDDCDINFVVEEDGSVESQEINLSSTESFTRIAVSTSGVAAAAGASATSGSASITGAPASSSGSGSGSGSAPSATTSVHNGAPTMQVGVLGGFVVSVLSACASIWL